MAAMMGQDVELLVNMHQRSELSTIPFQYAAALLPTYPPAPGVWEHCLPDPVSSLGAGVMLAVVLMSIIAALAWALAGIPEALGRALPLHGAPPTVGSPLLQGRARRLDMRALDGMRTVLVMYIVIYHVRWALPPAVAPWFQTGHWAVQFFFVLSGFVAACGYEASAGERSIEVDVARTMAVRRLTRLCLPYFVALLGVAAMVAFRGGGQPFLAWPIQALLLQSLLPVKVCGPLDVGHWSQNFLPFSANGTGWFVSAILITSLCFPAIYNARPRGGFLATLSALVLVIVGRSVPTLLCMAGWCPFDTYAFAPVRLLEFAAGVLAAQLFREMPAWAAECGAWDWIFDASLLCAAVPVYFLGSWPSWALSENSHGDYFLTAVFCLTCIAARGLASQQGDAGESRGIDGHCLLRSKEDETKERGCECQFGVRSFSGSPLSGLLCSRVLVAPAVYSYQAYVYQEIFITGLGLLSQEQIFRFWWLPVPLTWTAAAISVHLLEEPLKRVVEARIASTRRLSLSK